MNIHSTYAKTFIARGLRSSRDPWVAQLGLSSSFSRDDFDRNRGFGRIRNRRSANLFTVFFHAYSAVKSGCWPRRNLEREGEPPPNLISYQFSRSISCFAPDSLLHAAISRTSLWVKLDLEKNGWDSIGKKEKVAREEGKTTPII